LRQQLGKHWGFANQEFSELADFDYVWELFHAISS
jgi:hypothetical protein